MYPSYVLMESFEDFIIGSVYIKSYLLLKRVKKCKLVFLKQILKVWLRFLLYIFMKKSIAYVNIFKWNSKQKFKYMMLSRKVGILTRMLHISVDDGIQIWSYLRQVNCSSFLWILVWWVYVSLNYKDWSSNFLFFFSYMPFYDGVI